LCLQQKLPVYSFQIKIFHPEHGASVLGWQCTMHNAQCTMYNSLRASRIYEYVNPLNVCYTISVGTCWMSIPLYCTGEYLKAVWGSYVSLTEKCFEIPAAQSDMLC
jgi:hypothetical protein